MKTLEQKFNEVSQEFAKAVAEAINDVEAEFETNTAKDFTAILLTHIIGNLAFKALSVQEQTKGSKKKLKVYEDTVSEYEDFKTILTTSVASGLKQAVEHYTGQPIDYYCVIHATGTPTNANYPA